MTEMLSVLFGETPDVFKQVIDFYAKTLRRKKRDTISILDLTYGHGKLWGSIDYDYNLVTNDVDRESPAMWNFSLDKIVLESIGIFDLIIYDPPYLYGRNSHYLLTSEEKDTDWKTHKTKWTIQKQVETAQVLNKGLPKILTPNGLVIVKIMNTRVKRQLIRNNQIICENLTNFELKDEIIYIRTNVGFYRNPTTPQTAHGYYLVFNLIRKVKNAHYGDKTQ